MNGEIVDGLVDFPKYSSQLIDLPPHKCSNPPVTDLTHHHGLVVSIAKQEQTAEFYRRMSDINWGMYCERVIILENDEIFFALIFRET